MKLPEYCSNLAYYRPLLYLLAIGYYQGLAAPILAKELLGLVWADPFDLVGLA